MKITGKMSTFGGPKDMGVAPDEGVALANSVSDKPEVFLPEQPSGTTGLARRLDPAKFYLACRWSYDAPNQSKADLLQHKALVRSPKTGRQYLADPIDWGPHSDTGRVTDLSPGLATALGITTDDEVEVTYPFGESTEAAAMPYSSIAISSGHSTKCRGASSQYADEVDEATKVADKLGALLTVRGVYAPVFHDTVSTTQDSNLKRICDWHNSHERQLDCSIHFNASDNHQGQGTEVWYVSQDALADQLSAAMATAGGLKDRGGKQSSGLYFLNNTEMPAVLLEIVFCDNGSDVDKYREHFDAICTALADVLGGTADEDIDRPPQQPAQPRVDIVTTGNVVITINGVPVS